MKFDQTMLFEEKWYEIIISKSGSRQLNDDDRRNFVEKICERNVLLAALCKTNSNIDEPDLEDIISKKAIVIAKNSFSPINSSFGFRALAEIGHYDDIAQILKESNRETNFNKNIVINFVANASESQVIDFLEILLDINIDLFTSHLVKILMT